MGKKFDPTKFLSMVREGGKGSIGFQADALLMQLNEMYNATLLLESGELEQRQFITSMCKLLRTVDIHPTLAWRALEILESLCYAPSNEFVLMELQKMFSLVANLSLYATEENKIISLLKVLQKMTYGIKFARPDQFLGPLISSLVSWSKTDNNHTVQLSLSVLANVIHRNKTVLSILMQTVSLKNFMNDLLSVRGNILCSMEVCKLMFLLEDLIYEKPDEAEILNFIKVTFCTVTDVSSQGNKLQLQHCILFFEDMVSSKKITRGMLDRPWFIESVRNVMQLLNNGTIDPEIAMLLFRFLRIFVEMEIFSFYNLYEEVIEQGIAWVSKHQRKAGEAINTMHSVLASQPGNVFGLSVDDITEKFLPLLEIAERSNNDYVFLTILLSFLRQTLDIKAFSTVKNGLKDEVIELFFKSLPSDNSFWINFTLHEPAVKMYIHLLDFVFKFVTCCDASWMNFYTQMLREQKVLSVLAVALAFGSSDLKSKVFTLIAGVGFPPESFPVLAKTMEDCGKRRPSQDYEDYTCELSPSNASIDIEIKKLLRNIKNSLKENDDSSSVKILQLYEYKEQMHLEYQQSLLSSLANATNEKKLLQEMTSLNDQISSEIRQELYCLRMAFDDLSKKYESALQTNNQKSEKYNTLQARLEQETVASQKVIQKLEEAVQRLEIEAQSITKMNKTLRTMLDEKATEIDELSTERTELLKERDTFKEQTEENMKEQDKIRIQNAQLSEEVDRLTQELESKRKQLDEQNGENKKIKEEVAARDKKIEELQRIREIICEITSGTKKL